MKQSILTFCHHEHCACTLLFIYLFWTICSYLDGCLLPQNCLFFFDFLVQTTFMTQFVKYRHLNIPSLLQICLTAHFWSNPIFNPDLVDLCFWLLIVEDGQLTFCPEPLLHQTRHFCPEACCSLDVFSFFRSLYEMDGCQSLINWQFGRPVRLTWTAILCWKKHWHHLSP